MSLSRRSRARAIRDDAAEVASRRPHPRHINNGEEYEYRDCTVTVSKAAPPKPPSCPVTHIANYTKGLPHDLETGLLLNADDYKLFVTGIQSGDPLDFARTPLGPADPKAKPQQPGCPSVEQITCEVLDRSKIWQSKMAQDLDPSDAEQGARVRAWESAGAGNVFDLEGPDTHAVTMPPAPRFDSPELLAEIVEVYAMALTRDVSFRSYTLPDGAGPRPKDGSKCEKCGDGGRLTSAKDLLRQLDWFDGSDLEHKLTPEEICRRRTMANDGTNLFRGVTPGEGIGPYLSQFLLLGNTSFDSPGTDLVDRARTPVQGCIRYGAINIEQQARVATPCKDYMTLWPHFIDVQNGADLRGQETYIAKNAGRPPFRFIATPRDLATYVHHDALYEAYLNACLFLLSSGAPFDRGIPFLEADTFDKQQGFAHFGGPHILTLVTEVATRALKAVRYQKFNIHRRLRPEALGGLIDRFANDSQGTLRDGPLVPATELIEAFVDKDLKWQAQSFADAVREHNEANNDEYFNGQAPAGTNSYLLPMAFPEGSPMHPAYGAGHGTVAGACITIMKAYFDHGWTPPELFDDQGKPIAYEPSHDGSKLLPMPLDQPLTVEGELNKLAGNIAIGRNWAGVHYYSDYIESMRLGEQIAIGLLEEQKLTYPENFTMTVPLFDGGSVRI